MVVQVVHVVQQTDEATHKPAPSLFLRERHQAIAQVLHTLNAPLLRECQCWFAGGTAISLLYGEFRESVDIDFLVSDKQG